MGTHALTIRLRPSLQVRDALEDLEYMFLLDQLSGSRESVLAIVASVVTSAYEFQHDPLTMLKAREELAKSIESNMQIS